MSEHIMMCNVPNAGACFVPSCACGCHKSTEPRIATHSVGVRTVPDGVRIVPAGGRRNVDVSKEIADGRKWVRLHESNKYQREAAKRMTRLLNIIEAMSNGMTKERNDGRQ